MAIDKTSEIDAIGIHKGTGEVVLTVADERDWQDEDNHIALLQRKLNAYLRFIESGEMESVYPDARGRLVKIEILAEHPPTENGVTFIENTSGAVTDAGYSWEYRVIHA